LLIFPEGTYFDDVALSGDPFRINMNILGIVQTFDGSKKAEFRMVTANWRIADKCGSQLLEPEKKKGIKYNDIF
jgi:hypothetical protein